MRHILLLPVISKWKRKQNDKSVRRSAETKGVISVKELLCKFFVRLNTTLVWRFVCLPVVMIAGQ